MSTNNNELDLGGVMLCNLITQTIIKQQETINIGQPAEQKQVYDKSKIHSPFLSTSQRSMYIGM